MKHVAAFFLAVFALLLVAPPTVARAQDAEEPNDPGYRFYEAAAKRILKAAGDKVWEAAEQAKRRNFFQFAFEQAERALVFDPDQADAREYLGYVKRGREWALDDEAASKVSKQNVRGGSNGKQESQESFDKRVDEWREKILAKADEYVAIKYAQLGDECAAKGYPLQALKGYEAALRLDPENAKARKGLGYKKFGKVWLTEKQDEARRNASQSKEIKEESRFDTLLGTQLTKAESEHFRVEARLPLEEVKELCTTLEVAYAYYLADLGVEPTKDVFGRRAQFVFMEDGDQWTKWCDVYGRSELSRKMGGTGDHAGLVDGHRIMDGHTPILRKDSAVHSAIHMLNLKVFQLQGGAWIDEGLAYYYTVKVQETCLTHCVAEKEGDYARPGKEGGLKDWGEPGNWKPNVKELVRRKADLELRALVQKPLTQLEFDATIKAWAVISWMMDTDRDRFIELIGSLRGVTNHVKAIEQQYEMGMEELDQQWRTYALRNY